MKVLKELQALKELASMADDVACLQSEFNFYINLSSNYDCLKFLNFQSVNMDFRIRTNLVGQPDLVTAKQIRAHELDLVSGEDQLTPVACAEPLQE